MHLRLLTLALLFAPLASISVRADAAADSPTSNNRQITAVPAPGKVVIDGLDNDWDLSAGIWSYNNPTLVGKYGVWTHLMWDAQGVYVLMRYTDLSPLKNATRGKDFHNSWQADAFQARVVFDEKTPDEHQMHINGFYSSSEDKPYLLVHHGGFKKDKPYDNTGMFRQDQLDKYGNTMDAFGGKVVYRAWENGQGYNMETFWPWSYVRTNGLPLKAGDSFVLGIEAMWGSADGTSLTHRLVDNMKDDTVNRIFFFRAKDGWGKVVLSDKGRLSITEEQKQLQAARLKQFVNYDTAGSVPISYELPSDRDVTIAIDNAQGVRVRNLFGQYPRTKGAHTDHWDGLDDRGNPVPAGDYTARVVDHEPVSLKFLNSVYNSATPPWRTETGEKVWGSNHGNPTTAATRGNVILLGFTGTEGTSGTIRINPADSRILWTDVTELVDITLDDKNAYLLSRESWTKRVMIRRLNLETGKIVLFNNEARTTETVLPADYKTVPNSASIAYADGKLFAFIPGQGLWRVHPDTGAVEQKLDDTGVVAVEDHDDQLWALFSDGRVARLDVNGAVQAVAFTAGGLNKPVRLGISYDATRFAVSDQGTNQVFVYDAKGVIVHTLGHAYSEASGMRPAGKFIETDFIKPNGLDFDAQGNLWIAEASGTCRRITRWSGAGELDKQYWGAADYGGMSGFAVTYDSTRFIGLGIEFRLDPNPDILNRPTEEKPLMFHPDLADHARGVVYRYEGHDYAINYKGNNSGGFIIAKRGDDGVFRNVVSVASEDRRKKTPGKTWIDKNENGVEDTGDVVTPYTSKSHYWAAAWVRPDLTIVTSEQDVYAPTGMTESGVPLYDFQKPVRAKNLIRGGWAGDNTTPNANGAVGTMVMDRAGNISDGLNFATVDGRTGGYPNFYKRHDGPAARRGLIIAPFRANGVIEDVPGVGAITALGGDRGEWFLMTMDGLFLSNILQDSKGEVTLDETFVGQESFGGFIWRDEKGRILVQLGGPSFRISELKGLETTRKQSIPLSLTPERLAEGIRIAAAAKKDAYSEPETLTLARVEKVSTAVPSPDTAVNQTLIEGAITARVQESGDPSRWFRVALAQDGTQLAVAFQVNDPSPWKNGEGRYSHAFIGGDCVDLQLAIPGRGAIRLLGAPVLGENTVVYWQKKAETKDNPTTYVVSNNEANAQVFDVVRRLTKAKIRVETGSGKYTVLITVPLAELGLDATTLAKTAELKGVAGVIYSDPAGTNRAARLYWHNKQTGLVSDVPSEARLEPAQWGTVQLTK